MRTVSRHNLRTTNSSSVLFVIALWVATLRLLGMLLAHEVGVVAVVRRSSQTWINGAVLQVRRVTGRALVVTSRGVEKMWLLLLSWRGRGQRVARAKRAIRNAPCCNLEDREGILLGGDQVVDGDRTGHLVSHHAASSPHTPARSASVHLRDGSRSANWAKGSHELSANVTVGEDVTDGEKTGVASASVARDRGGCPASRAVRCGSLPVDLSDQHLDGCAFEVQSDHREWTSWLRTDACWRREGVGVMGHREAARCSRSLRKGQQPAKGVDERLRPMCASLQVV